MVNLSATEDEWQSDDETGYENPYDYDPNAVDENDPTVDGDDPSLNSDEDTEEITEDDEDGALAEIEPMYGSVVEWVEGWFTKVIRRRMGSGGGEGGLAWDERWWLYPEVAGRLTAAWYAWEEARASDKPSAMSHWWIQHLEPHLRVIFDGETGPMSHAKADGSFSGWPALPTQSVPPELLDGLLNDPAKGDL
ncbi:DUF4913 domain-containing protein [Rhodococcus koreensis]|uniref:DUF4913 domain-containing protein n=1 Tax=Rhodococcus koreensis TaxID=99653 RepID=A0A1H4I5U2_9NOCA|nr:DUF4913 domain-containing protein [Rhodococcus koreensis]SEB29291.1 protein of unknown function [Rhodococcus koreensis]